MKQLSYLFPQNAFHKFSKNFGDGNMITNNNKLKKNVKDVQDDKNRKIKIEKKEGRRRRSGSLSWFYCIPFKINKKCCRHCIIFFLQIRKLSK